MQPEKSVPDSRVNQSATLLYGDTTESQLALVL